MGATLENDADLKAAVASSVQAAFDDRKKYMDLFKSGSGFGEFKQAIDESGMLAPVARVLVYGAAAPGYRSVRDWGHRKDANDDEWCTRGPMKLSFAQAYNLDFRDYQIDTWMSDTTRDEVKIEINLERTADRVKASVGNPRNILNAPAGSSGRDICYYESGADDRDDVGPLARRLNEVLGVRGSKLPKEGGAFWIAARVTKLYAADLEYTKRMPSREQTADHRSAKSGTRITRMYLSKRMFPSATFPHPYF